MARTPNELIPTRWSLINRLKQWDDSASWQEFFNTYWRLIYAVAVKTGLTETEAQEVVQETIISVAKQMPQFKVDPELGSFKGWLLQLTRRRIVDQLRKRPPPDRFQHSAPAETARTATVERISDPAGPPFDRLWELEWQQNLFETAISRVRQQVNPKQFQVFHLLVVKQMSVEQVAEMLKLKTANVYLVKHRVGALIKKEIEQIERQTG
jgi:RNA polymerase sigma factor (sigma-70 family)